MKLISYKHKGVHCFGLVVYGGVLHLNKRLPGVADCKQLLQKNLLSEAEAFSGLPADVGFDGIEFLPPIPEAGKYICIGVNYPSRNEEYNDASQAPQKPSVFLRTAESFVGHQQPLLKPPESDQLDYEGEIVLIIGKEGRRIPESSALDYVAGISAMNEGTIRDWVRHGKFNVTQGKNFTASGSWGPWIVTRDEYPSLDKLEVKTTVNNEVRQHDTTDRLMFSFSYLISYLSTFFTLKPGDVIATGTPVGAGARFDPPKFLKAGDIVQVSVQGVGTLQNSVSEELT